MQIKSILWKTLCAALMMCATCRANQVVPEQMAAFDIPRLENIAIDGRGDDWGQRGFLLDALAPISEELRPVANFDARVRLGWNARGLLLLATVRDDKNVESQSDTSLWDGDSIEVFVAKKLGAKSHYQLIASPGLNAVQSQLRTHFEDRRAGENKTPLSVQAARTRTSGGYVIEMLMPWRNSGIEPKLGRSFAMQIGINDRDDADSRAQMMWYPEAGAWEDAARFYTLRLSQKPGAPVRVAATGYYQLLRRAKIQIVAPRAMAGKTVDIFNGNRVIARVPLYARDGRALGKATVPAPPIGRNYPLLRVARNRQALAALQLPDLEKERREAARYLQVKGSSAVFDGEKFPHLGFEEPSYAEDVIGEYSLAATFYDAAQNVVTKALKPGRYGAIVKIKAASGIEMTRFVTLFRYPERISWRKMEMPVSAIVPEGFGIDPQVSREQSKVLQSFFKWRFIDGFSQEPETAELLAGLYETKPGDSTVNRFNAEAKNIGWWYDLKKKTGYLKPYRTLVSLPKGYNDDTGKRWPLVLFLHGSGERGDDLELVKKHGPPKQIASGQDLPFITVSPQCPLGEQWVPMQLRDLLDEVGAQLRVDPDRVYVTGLSMGGYATWDLALMYPERFAAIVPICGVGDPQDAARISSLPTWVFHGGKDESVPVERSQEMVAALKEVGNPVLFTLYPDAGHDSWTQSYDNPLLYQWLLQQRRGQSMRPVITRNF